MAANTLIPVDYDPSLVEQSDDVLKYKEQLKELNHKIFLAKRNADKQRLKDKIKETRNALAQAIEDTGFVAPGAAQKLAHWDMFDQNASTSFFDAEWMFGVKGGFDIVIANPPYVVVPKANIYFPYFKTNLCYELYAYFFEKSYCLLKNKGVLAFITASLYIKGLKFTSLRDYLEKNMDVINLKVVGDNVFENVQMPTAVYIGIKTRGLWRFVDMIAGGNILEKIEKSGVKLDWISNICRGFEIGRNLVTALGTYPFLTGSNVGKYAYDSLSYVSEDVFQQFSKDDYYFTGPRLLLRETGSYLTVLYLEDRIYSNRSLYSIKIIDINYPPKYVLACLNSKALQYYYSSKFKNDTELFPKIRIKQARQLPIPSSSEYTKKHIESIVDEILSAKKNGLPTINLEQEIDLLVYQLYGLSYDEVLVVDPETKITREEYEKGMGE